MTNCIFFLFITCLFMNFSLGSISYFGVHRTFMLMFRGVIENALKSVDKSGEPVSPYFDEDLLKANVEEYLDKNITRYTHEYETNYYFYYLEDKTYCSNDYCRGVRISLRAKIDGMFQYEKAKSFSIKTKEA